MMNDDPSPFTGSVVCVGQCGPVGWWGHTAAHCGHPPHTADILLPAPGSTHQPSWARRSSYTTSTQHTTPHSLDPPDTEGGIFHYPWLEEDVEVDNVETLTMVISFTIDNFSGEAFIRIRNEGKP